MAKVTKKHSKESFESLLRRFKKAVEQDGIINRVREKEFYEKPSAAKKRAKAAAVKRTEREKRKQQKQKRLY